MVLTQMAAERQVLCDLKVTAQLTWSQDGAWVLVKPWVQGTPDGAPWMDASRGPDDNASKDTPSLSVHNLTHQLLCSQGTDFNMGSRDGCLLHHITQAPWSWHACTSLW